MTIQYLTYQQIDKQKWDACISNASNGLIYGNSFYLDALAMQWDAIVLNDYEAVLPLPWKKKWGIKYYYIPPFTPQLGIFKTIEEINIEPIIALFKSKVKFGDVSFNYENSISAATYLATNYIINLQQGYETIAANYKDYLKTYLKRSTIKDCTISGDENFATALSLYQQYYAPRMPHVKREDYANFLSLCQYLFAKKMAFTRAVLNAEGEIISIAIFFRDKKRIYYVLSSNTPKGKKLETNHLLLDAVLKEFAGENMIFDFEGSDLPGVKTFYEKFGPINQPYPFLHYNNLPFPLRLLKQ